MASVHELDLREVVDPVGSLGSTTYTIEVKNLKLNIQDGNINTLVIDGEILIHEGAEVAEGRLATLKDHQITADLTTLKQLPNIHITITNGVIVVVGDGSSTGTIQTLSKKIINRLLEIESREIQSDHKIDCIDRTPETRRGKALTLAVGLSFIILIIGIGILLTHGHHIPNPIDNGIVLPASLGNITQIIGTSAVGVGGTIFGAYLAIRAYRGRKEILQAIQAMPTNMKNLCLYLLVKVGIVKKDTALEILQQKTGQQSPAHEEGSVIDIRDGDGEEIVGAGESDPLIPKAETEESDIISESDMYVRNKFVISNTNDITGSVLFILLGLMALGFIAIAATHGPGAIATFSKGALAYPTGAMLCLSGLYQVYESSLAIKNATSKRERMKAVANLINSLGVILLGYLTITGALGSVLGIGTTLGLGVLGLYINRDGYKASQKEKNAIFAVENNPEAKLKYLREKLSLTQEDYDEIELIQGWDDAKLAQWIEANQASQDIETKFIAYLNEQTVIEKAKLLLEVKEMMISEEMKNKLDAKISAFAANLEETTLQEALDCINGKDGAKGIDEVFEKVKTEVNKKYNAEWYKFWVLNMLFFLVPAAMFGVGLAGITIPAYAPAMAAYYIPMAGLGFANAYVNSTSRYRNVPKTFRNKPMNIREKLAQKRTTQLADRQVEVVI